MLKFKQKVIILAEKVKQKGKINMEPTADPSSQWYKKPDQYILAKSAFY